jgi:hypothetical protein
MNPLTVAIFRTLFPEFTKVTDTALEVWLPIASSRVPFSIWSTNTQYATALLLAHMLTASGKSGLGSGGGAVTSESVGDLSRGFATVGQPGSGDQELLTTRYGQDFVALRRETVVAASVTGPTTLPPNQSGWPCGW